MSGFSPFAYEFRYFTEEAARAGQAQKSIGTPESGDYFPHPSQPHAQLPLLRIFAIQVSVPSTGQSAGRGGLEYLGILAAIGASTASHPGVGGLCWEKKEKGRERGRILAVTEANARRLQTGR